MMEPTVVLPQMRLGDFTFPALPEYLTVQEDYCCTDQVLPQVGAYTACTARRPRRVIAKGVLSAPRALTDAFLLRAEMRRQGSLLCLPFCAPFQVVPVALELEAAPGGCLHYRCEWLEEDTTLVYDETEEDTPATYELDEAMSFPELSEEVGLSVEYLLSQNPGLADVFWEIPAHTVVILC